MKKLVFKKVEFLKSCKNIKNAPVVYGKKDERLPEIAIAGRSNVGKSTLLNNLFKAKSLVKTSRQPGKTQLLNFFQVDDDCIFCDLPGYGYAKVNEKTRSNWKTMIESYIKENESLKLILMLLDIRRTPSIQDQQFLDWVLYYQKEVVLVFTKVDKVSKNVLKKNATKIIETLSSDSLKHVYYSALKKIGRKELIAMITPFI